MRRLHEAFLGAWALTTSARVGAFVGGFWLNSTLESFSLKTKPQKKPLRVRGYEIYYEVDGGLEAADVVLSSPRPRRCRAPQKNCQYRCLCTCAVCTDHNGLSLGARLMYTMLSCCAAAAMQHIVYHRGGTGFSRAKPIIR